VFLALFGAPVERGFTPRQAGREGPPYETHDHGPHDPPATMLLPLWVLAILSVAIGVYFTFVHPEVEFESPAWLMPAAVGVAVAGIALAWLAYQRRSIDAVAMANAFGPIRSAALARFWLDDLFEGVYKIAFLAFSRVIGWIDRYLVDGILNALSAWTLTAGDDVRSIQSGKAQDYVYGVAVGLLVLLLWASWVAA